MAADVEQTRPFVSVVAPFFNESESLGAFCGALRVVMNTSGYEYEVILVDDGSSDSSVSIALSMDWPQAQILQLLANSGHQAALEAGIGRCRGDYVVTMDSDLQHPPALVPAMVQEAIRTQSDVVYGVRASRAEDSAFKRLTARSYYRLTRRLSGVDLIENAADYRLLSRFAVDALLGIPGRKVYRLLVPALGFRSATVEFTADERFAGQSKYTLGKMLALAVLSSLEFSRKPLRIAAATGLVTALVAVLWLVYVVVSFARGDSLVGWPSLMSVVLILGGATLFCLGVIGEYIGEIYRMIQGRPDYIVRRVLRTENDGDPVRDSD